MILAFPIYQNSCGLIITFLFLNYSDLWYKLINSLYSATVAQAEQAT
jgi:hypothetical protein